LAARNGRLTGLQFASPDPAPDALGRPDKTLDAACRQLDAYFAGQRVGFSLPLELDGTPFQRRVWSALQDIPYGETRSYSQLAQAIGGPCAVRAVGAANGRNPIAIIVPCHRVVGATGALVGFGGGLDRKKFLLNLEQGRDLHLTA
jgi:methylated-DNA-[protein]-cysteine S-methyltransferase